MKVKTEKICRNKGCNNKFKLFKSTDKYCSPSCLYANAKEQKPRQAIKPKSKKLEAAERAYSVLRKKFLECPENKQCAVFPNLPATEVHHAKGRGAFLLTVEYWVAVSRVGHNWIHENDAEARRKGWLLSRTQNVLK